QPGAWVPLSQNEALRMTKSSGGTGAPAGAMRRAGGLASLDKLEDTKLAWPDPATAYRGKVGDGPADSGALSFDVTPALWRGGFKAASRH
ncbi:MAG: hypothetical protein ACRECP_11365, partial [Methylocella sp.]